MADIRPFKAYRPAVGLEKVIASPPYDVINSKEAQIMASGNRHSFLHISKPEIDLPQDIDHYDDRVYAKARENMLLFLKEGWLVQDNAESFYVYRQIMGDHSQTGLVAGTSCQEYIDNKIKKHEFTRKDKEDDRTRHMEALNLNAGPVFLTYRAKASIDAIVGRITAEKPAVEIASDDGIKHIVWVISDKPTVDSLIAEFGTVDNLYVADGHHRSASAVRVYEKRRAEKPDFTGKEPWCHFMSVIFPHNQLRIMDYNRVVQDLNGLNPEQFLAKVGEKFEIGPGEFKKPENQREYRMLLENKWYTLSPKEGTFDPNDPVKGLDVSILQDNLLEPILGIKDPRTDNRIDFIGGIRGIEELAKRCKEGFAVAFAFYPTTIDQLLKISDVGQVMPPKSTWFEPKLRSGLIVRALWTDKP